jgi:hypothetical protein
VTASERTAVIAELRQQPDSIFDGCRTMIGESAWYHWASSLTRWARTKVITEAAHRRA